MSSATHKLGRESCEQDESELRVTRPQAAFLPCDKSQDSPLLSDRDSTHGPDGGGVIASSEIFAAKHDHDARPSSEDRVEHVQPWPQKPNQAKYTDFKPFHATSSNSPRYMVRNIMNKTKKLPFEQPTLDDAEFETLTRLMDDKQKHTVPSFKAKMAFRAFYFLLLAALIYFVLVGWPLWPGTVVWFWRWYQGQVGQHHIAGLVAFLAAGMIRNILPQFLCTFQVSRQEPREPEESAVSQCCVIIPCYKAAETLRTTLPACLAIFGPKQIFVVANGNSTVPLDNTADICDEFGVRHFWLPVGSKITAEFVGVTLGKEFQYCLLIDDDVLLPPSLPILTKWFNGPGHENVACVGYTIKSVGSNSSRGTIVQQAQDLEYKIAGLTKVFQSKYGSTVFPHGAIALWRRDVLEKILRAHPGYSISEDWWLGHTARAAGYRILMSSSVFVETETPPRLFPDWFFCRAKDSRGGYGEMSVVQQRFFRWSFFYLFRIWANTLYLIFSWRLGWRVLITKMYVLGEIYDTLIKLFTPVFLPVAMIAHWRLTLILWFGTILANFVLSIWFNVIHLSLLRRGSSKNERVSWLAFPAFFVIKFVMTFVTVASVYWTIYQYAVFFARQHLRVTESVPAWKVIREKKENMAEKEPELSGVASKVSETNSWRK
ncbi:uncharacterized protein G6M90_00g001740 [Metarhizium brunneum]|uniref:Uncharacterized protein n=1 Tax=Metarhizium brunneum TaxID=500148 RepID=A0A7D5YYS5_9HYPO